MLRDGEPSRSGSTKHRNRLRVYFDLTCAVSAAAHCGVQEGFSGQWPEVVADEVDTVDLDAAHDGAHGGVHDAADAATGVVEDGVEPNEIGDIMSARTMGSEVMQKLIIFSFNETFFWTELNSFKPPSGGCGGIEKLPRSKSSKRDQREAFGTLEERGSRVGIEKPPRSTQFRKVSLRRLMGGDAAMA